MLQCSYKLAKLSAATPEEAIVEKLHGRSFPTSPRNKLHSCHMTKSWPSANLQTYADDTMNALQSKKLSNQQKLALEGKLTKQELETQLFKHIKNTSAPGIDGFTVAWVNEFWPDLCDLCVESVNMLFFPKIELL